MKAHAKAPLVGSQPRLRSAAYSGSLAAMAVVNPLAIVAGAQTFAHVNLSFGRAQIGSGGAVFDNVQVTSFRNEPIAKISHLEIAYDLRDLLPGGRRLFGLKSVEADTPLRHDRSACGRNLQRADSAAEAHRGEPRSAAHRARTRAQRLDRCN